MASREEVLRDPRSGAKPLNRTERSERTRAAGSRPRPAAATSRPRARSEAPRRTGSTPRAKAASSTAPPVRVLHAGGAPRGSQPAKRKEVTLGQAARGLGRGASAVTSRTRYSAKGMLMAELLAGGVIVVIRTVADYEPQSDGTLKGTIGHPKGQYGPLPIAAGLIGTFFLLSFLAARGGTKGKVAVIAGGLIILVLAMKSNQEFQRVAETFSTFGKAKVPPGDWQTSGPQAGSPFGTSDVAPGGGSGQPVKPTNGKCPPGYGLAPNGMCYAQVQPGPPAT